MVRLQIDHKTVYENLMQASSGNLWNEKWYFSITEHPLNIEETKTRVMSAVYCARYVNWKLMDISLCLTLRKTLLDKTLHQFTYQDYQLEPRQVAAIFRKQNGSSFPFSL
jgi:hypothetical protein